MVGRGLIELARWLGLVACVRLVENLLRLDSNRFTEIVQGACGDRWAARGISKTLWREQADIR